MTKIAVLLPYADMADMVQKVIREENYQIGYVKAIESEHAVNEVRLAIEQGAKIIVARGYQARLIKSYTNIPVVEMRFHAQEVGLLVQSAKRLTHKEHPVIGMITFENMLCDLSHMEELFDVRLLISYIGRIEEVPDILHSMKKEGVDCVIGGDIVCMEAEKAGCFSVRFAAAEESVRDALERAKHMAYAVENEKKNAAQFEAVSGIAFNGIIKINAEFRIIAINRLVENLLGKDMGEVKGEMLYDVLPQIDRWIIDDILGGRRENYSSSIEIRGRSWMFLAAPIQFDGQVTGEILSLHVITEIVRRSQQMASDMLLHGYTAETRFSNIYTENEMMRTVLSTAKGYSLSDSPVMIYAETGTEYYEARIILDRVLDRTDAMPMEHLDVRIIAAAQKNLRHAMNKGDFRESLYYVLHGLTLEIPSLNRHPEDLRYYIDKYFKEFCQKSALLEKYRGNRKLAAQELGISTTTLWRKMNKYGIESKYGTDGDSDKR